MISFRDWINARESSAFTRLRHNAALGLMPPIAPASVNSRSTASPFEVEKLGKGKKCKCKKKKEKLEESKIDDFLNAVGALKDDTKKLKDKEKEAKLAPKKEAEPKQEVKPDETKPGKKCRWVCED